MHTTIKTLTHSIAIAIVFASCSNTAKELPADAVAVISQDSMIKRGEYLVNSIGCHDCHSPKVFGPQGPMPDTARLLSGHPADMPIGAVDPAALKDWVLLNMHMTAAVGPWGVSYAANITSDATGIGNWTNEQFRKAMREGKYKGLDGARLLLPPMPWQNFRNLSDTDVDAIFAYLKTSKPVPNVVPAPKTMEEMMAAK